jgi:hypothetical protein
MQLSFQISRLKPMIIGFLSVFVSVLLFSCSKNAADSAQPAGAEIATTKPSSEPIHQGTNYIVPFDNTFFVPCANGGAGEDVIISGFLNYTYEGTWSNDGFKIVYHDNAQHVTGTGVSSGESFVGSGNTNGIAIGSWVNDQWIGSTTGQLKLVSKNASFTVRYKYHMTVTRDGKVTIYSEALSEECN